MDLISLYGAGLLVGAALIIIIPEGMTVLSNALREMNSIDEASSVKVGDHSSKNVDELTNRYIGLALIIGFTVMLVID